MAECVWGTCRPTDAESLPRSSSRTFSCLGATDSQCPQHSSQPQLHLGNDRKHLQTLLPGARPRPERPDPPSVLLAQRVFKSSMGMLHAQPGLQTTKLAGRQVLFEDHGALRSKAPATGEGRRKPRCLCRLALDMKAEGWSSFT